MPRAATLLAHIAFMRIRASVLKGGDSEAQRRADELEREAEAIERDCLAKECVECVEVA